jgi:23S rRNA pseudouridine2605 synthase
MEERLQKILSRSGFGSRRACEGLIATGRVRVNGQVATLGGKADPNRDQITVDGKLLPKPEPSVYIALYKPRGVLSTVEAPDPRPTVRDLVPVSGQIYPVGRLDVDSEGLILLTNDGELTNRLTHPRYQHEKEYRVLVARRPDEEQLQTWRRGVVLEDGYHTAPAQVQVESTSGKGAWLQVILREGRKRQIREVGSLIGLPVVKIIRVRIGSLQLGNLKPREWRHLSSAEVSALKGQLNKTQVRSIKNRFKPRKPEPRFKKNGEPSRLRRTSEKSRRG